MMTANPPLHVNFFLFLLYKKRGWRSITQRNTCGADWFSSSAVWSITRSYKMMTWAEVKWGSQDATIHVTVMYLPIFTVWEVMIFVSSPSTKLCPCNTIIFLWLSLAPVLLTHRRKISFLTSSFRMEMPSSKLVLYSPELHGLKERRVKNLFSQKLHLQDFTSSSYTYRWLLYPSSITLQITSYSGFIPQCNWHRKHVFTHMCKQCLKKFTLEIHKELKIQMISHNTSKFVCKFKTV